jgi:predicted RNA binding protein YcfA (HicA-like mRNA interferase family)
VPPIGPIKRNALIRAMRDLGFTGPHGGGKHEYMERQDGLRVRIPNPHRGDIGTGLLMLVLREAEITREVWEQR